MGTLILIIVIFVVIVVFLNSRYNIRSQGTKTEGQILRIDRHTTTDSYGIRHTSYYATYEFHDDSGQRWTGEKSMGGNRRKKVGDRVNVYYLPKNPRRSDVDW
ncbi:DUF3592 domain-containing protein [Lusitaniella coriacea LEGE 07157]|uniref:DUF3592 domain-containing protein n=1 Tax=Lusitaniella coriacea LEGE 07157 TaxID=945747 RepID=A0A8J7J3H8_9CYAN|nr:DUF3592 domain-containing protein [Lusitaniella coriacea]MBE9116944.1 DUF3592 domain-containing protein [Lusitaniella coriacea LEGE 07157]